MSNLEQANQQQPNGYSSAKSFLPNANIRDILKQVSEVVAPVWPLKDYVAVNPYFGIHERKFMDARAFLKVFSDCETLMPFNYYADQYQRAGFDREDIAAAIAELSEVGLEASFSADEIASRLEAGITEATTLDQPAPEANPYRCIKTIAEIACKPGSVDWIEVIRDEVSKCCAAHYDQGQASWQSPWRGLSLYEGWRSMSKHDRSVEMLGMVGFRDYVRQLPDSAEEAIVASLLRMKIPQPLWSTFLLCQAFSIPGWSAWTKYQDTETDRHGDDHFAALLAMRLTYDLVLGEALNISGQWEKFVHDDAVHFPMPTSGTDSVLRYLLLRASEIGFRKSLLASIEPSQKPVAATSQKLAQMVFCIDVRSERIRRQIESVSADVETFGFAGFFGIPIAYGSLSEPTPVAHLPVLLKPQFEVNEGLDGDCCTGAADLVATDQQVETERVDLRSWRKLWRGFQTSAVGCFSFVETTGAFFGLKLLRRILGRQVSSKPSWDGVSKSQRDRLGPTLRNLEMQGVGLEKQVELVHGMLSNLGLKKDFAKLVVLCGHASQTENNPLAAGLDCGACGGHSGEPNARFAARLANQPEIRSALREKGIIIPDETHFLAAVHNTTTDEIEFFDLHRLPASHQSELEQLKTVTAQASLQTRNERMPIVSSKTMSDLMRRAADWSEVRPEWGLAGNAAFIVAPRSMTQNADLDGRSFLHSYDHNLDPDGAVLELIMTAPMVVANWINMQYYASTVDNHHFGSGNKTVHNVVGQFGVLSGNGGDLKTGLPWQSLHTGSEYQHLPMRLQVVIAAPRQAIERVIQKHELVGNLITNGWLHLVAIEQDHGCFRYSANSTWEQIESPRVETH